MAFEGKPIQELPAAEALDGLQFVAADADNNAVRVPAGLLPTGEYIPLTGTVEGEPVAGDIEMGSEGSEGFAAVKSKFGSARRGYLKFFNDNRDVRIEMNEFVDDSEILLSRLSAHRNKYILVEVGDEGPGIKGGADYFLYYDPNTYVQYSVLPKVADNYPDDTAAATAGIQIGKMYHTDGVVKIRLS